MNNTRKYTPTLKNPSEVLEALAFAFNGFSQIPDLAYIQATVGQLNNSQNAFSANMQEGIDEYTKEMFITLKALFDEYEWDLEWNCETFHTTVNKKFWEINKI